MDTPLFTFAEFIEAFPEFEGTTEMQFDLWYCFAEELFGCFAGAKTEKARALLMRLGVAHVGSMLCDPSGAQVIEIKTMNSTEKFKAIEYDPNGFTLYRTNYGQMIQDFANTCYIGPVAIVTLRQGPCQFNYRSRL